MSCQGSGSVSLLSYYSFTIVLLQFLSIILLDLMVLKSSKSFWHVNRGGGDNQCPWVGVVHTAIHVLNSESKIATENLGCVKKPARRPRWRWWQTGVLRSHLHASLSRETTGKSNGIGGRGVAGRTVHTKFHQGAVGCLPTAAGVMWRLQPLGTILHFNLFPLC